MLSNHSIRKFKPALLTGGVLMLMVGSHSFGMAVQPVDPFPLPTRNVPPQAKLIELAVIKEASRNGKPGVGGQLIRFQTPKKLVDGKTGDKLYLGDGLKVQRQEKVVLLCLVNQKTWTVPNNGALWGVANGCPLPNSQKLPRSVQTR
jgi:hypothetical protein